MTMYVFFMLKIGFITLLKTFSCFVDFVYFEVAPGAPYQIRKIEELNKIVSCCCLVLIFCEKNNQLLSSFVIEPKWSC